MITKLTASHVVGFDGTDHVIHHDAEVVFQDDAVVFVGRGYTGPTDEVIDAGHAVVSPGFIDLDALADIDHALIDSWQDATTSRGLQWSKEYFSRREETFSFQDTVFKRQYALTQLIRHGITTAMPIAAETHSSWAETYRELAAVADFAARIGLRMYLGPSFRSGVNVVDANGDRDVCFDEPSGASGLAEAIRFVQDFDRSHDDLIRGCLLPCRIETLTPGLMRAIAEAAGELDCLVRLHCLQGAFELEYLRDRYGRTPLQLLSDTGLLGSRLLIPHATQIHQDIPADEGFRDPLNALAASGATVIHCPLTSVRYGSVLDSFDRFRHSGVNLALGTDSFPPDMIRNMDYGNNLAKLADRRLDAGSAADYFRAATLGGANALGRADLGRLTPGAKADIAVVDLSAPRIGPVDDPIRTMLMSGAQVTTTIVNGRVVMRDHVIPDVDEADFARRAQRYFTRMKAAYPDRDYLRRSESELFPPSFNRV